MKLAYRHGFRETSLADIAEAARVPVGNVYYYFKAKEELAEAVVERRLEVQANREQLARDGCPLGDLFSELHKEGGTLARKSATLFTEQHESVA
jgi:TetR/AcrR family transcriptional repressor of nem operon